MNFSLLIICIAYFLTFCLPSHPMSEEPKKDFFGFEQPKTLKNICIPVITNQMLALESYDLETEKQRIKETLEKLPEELQQEIINTIDCHVIPTWVKKVDRVENQYFTCISINNNLLSYKDGNFASIQTLAEPTIVTRIFKRFIRGIITSPDASLMALVSPKHIDIFSLTTLPLERRQRIHHAGVKNLGFTYEAAPRMLVVDSQGFLSIYTQNLNNNFSPSQYSFPSREVIQGLAIAPDNSYAIATTENPDEHSFFIDLKSETPIFKSLAKKGLSFPHIASNSSFFVARYQRKSFIQKLSGQSTLIPGDVISIKNNHIIIKDESKERTQFKIFNQSGSCCYSFDYPWFGLPFGPYLTFTGGMGLYVAQECSPKDIDKLVVKMLFKKADQEENLEVLEKLSAYKPIQQCVFAAIKRTKRSLERFMPLIKDDLNRMKNGLQPQHSLFYSGITTKNQLTNRKRVFEPDEDGKKFD